MTVQDSPIDWLQLVPFHFIGHDARELNKVNACLVASVSEAQIPFFFQADVFRPYFTDASLGHKDHWLIWMHAQQVSQFSVILTIRV